MNRWRLLFAGIILSMLCACATQPGSSSRTTLGPQGLPVLSCAVVSKTGLLTISYPAEKIYRNGAALPSQEGLACLQELANGLQRVPKSRWQVTVAGEDGYGFDPLQLAGKRQELLQRFFTRKGIETKDWQWQTTAAQNDQLQLLEFTETP